MPSVAPEHRHGDKDEGDGSQSGEDHRGVTIKDIGEDSGVDNRSEPSGDASYFQEDSRGYSRNAICATSSSTEIQRFDEDVSRGSSTQYSDVDSLDGDESGSWNNDVNSVAVEQRFDNGVALPISDVPNFGDIRVKNSANVHFGNKTFYNGPVTIKQIVYANPTVSQNGSDEDIINSVAGATAAAAGDKLPGEGVSDFIRNGSTRVSGFARTTAKSVDNETERENHKEIRKDGRRGLATIFIAFLAETVQPTHDQRHPLLVLSLLAISFSVTQFCAWLLTWKYVALICAVGCCLVASVVVSAVLLSRKSEASLTPVAPDTEGLPLGKVRFISRNEWGAEPPTEPLTKLQHPVPYVIISHTATDFCKTQSECTYRVRFAQTFHIESRGWSDIAYNFLVGGDGYAYVGRSWDYIGAHSYNYNSKSIGISFIGTFNTIVPPERQLHAAKQLIELGVETGMIAADYKLLAHRQVSSTLSPGDALYNVLKTWPHWSPEP